MLYNKYGKLKIRLARFLVFIFLMMIIIALGFNSYLRQNDIKIEALTFSKVWDVFFGQREPLERTRLVSELQFTSGSNTRFNVYRHYIVEASKLGLRFYDKRFKEEESFPFAMNRPSIKINDPYIVVGDTNGKQIRVFRGGQEVWSRLLEENILSFDISRSGYLAVVHERQKYRSGLTVFNSEGEVSFSMGTVEDFLLVPSIQSTSDGVIINRLNVSDVGIDSILQFVDFDGKAGHNITLEDVFITKIDYLNDGSIVVFGDNSVRIFDRDGDKKWVRNYSGIFSATILEGRFLTLATSFQDDYDENIFNKTRVEILVGQDLRGSIELGGRVNVMDSSGSVVSLATARSVYVIDNKARLIGQFESEQDIIDIKMIDENTLVVVGHTRASLVKVD